jgi:type II secretion system protein F
VTRTFGYKARDRGRRLVEGSLAAETEQEALAKLGEMGYFPLSIEGEEPSAHTDVHPQPLGRLTKIRRQDLTLVTRQLADLLEAGLTLMRALDVLREQTEHPRVREVLAEVASQVRDGRSFSESLAIYPRIFSPLYISMVRSGEVGGMLGGVLARLADISEKEDEVYSKVRSALAYPALILLVGMGTVTALLIFVIPKLVSLFHEVGQTLPLPTRILIEVSRWLGSYGWLLVLGAAGGAVLVRRSTRSPGGRLVIDRTKLRLPLWGSLIKRVELARFARTLATLLSHGVPILPAMQVAVQATGNELLRRELQHIGEQLRGGTTLSQGMRRGRLFPALVIHMVAVGEEAGALERSLLKIADTYEREVDRLIRMVTSLVEPVMILLVGSVVGFIVISMLLPIFQIDLLAR